MNGQKVDVWVMTPDSELFNFVSTTTAEYGEIVAALQVLYPNMIGLQIEPAGETDGTKVS